jgi:hypothetical protein
MNNLWHDQYKLRNALIREQWRMVEDENMSMRRDELGVGERKNN